MIRQNKKGIVLITTMLTIVLVVMLVSSIVYSNIGGLRLTGAFAARESALLAAQSGVHYAITRLQEDPTWIGAPNLDEENKFNSPKGMDVIERDGNVLGRFQTPDGRPLFFRIKFNYEDGEGGFDNLNNSSSHPIRSRFVSCNNLYRTTDTQIYAADADGVLKRESDKDNPWGVEVDRLDPQMQTSSYTVPKSTAVLIVEGFAGNSLQDMTTVEVANLKEGEDYPREGSAPQLARRVIEVYLKVDYTAEDVDAVAYAAGDMALVGNTIRTRVEDGAKSANLYVANDVDIRANQVELSTGSSVRYGGNHTILDVNNNTYAGREVDFNQLTSVNDSAIQAIPWKDVRKAGPDATKLKSGYYVWKRVVNDEEGRKKWRKEQNQLFYYPTEELYLANKGKTDGYRYDGPWGDKKSAFAISKNDASITFRQDVLIETNESGCQDFVVLYEQDGFDWAPRPIVGFQTPKGAKSQPVLTYGSEDANGKQQVGNIRIQGAVMGGGLISATGDITFQGPSVLESEPGVGPSVYAMGDVEIEGITSQSSTAEEANPSQDVEKEPGSNPNPPGNTADQKLLVAWDNRGMSRVEEGDGLLSCKGKVMDEFTHCSDSPFDTDGAEDLLAKIQTIYLEFMHEAVASFSSWRWDDISDSVMGYELDKMRKVSGLKRETWLPKIRDAILEVGRAQGLEVAKMSNEDNWFIGDGDGDVKGYLVNTKAFNLYNYMSRLAMENAELYSNIKDLYENPNPEPDPEEDDGMTHLDGDSTQLDKDKVNAMVPEDVVSENYVLHKENYLNSLLNTWGSVGYADQDISGTIYAQGNIKIDIGRGSRLNLTGTMVAYGNDPSTGRPGGSGSTTVTEDGESLRAGSITMVAQQVDLAANPNYTRGLLDQIPCAHVKRVMYAVY